MSLITISNRNLLLMTNVPQASPPGRKKHTKTKIFKKQLKY